MDVCNNNMKVPRPDEKRNFLLPLILLLAGVIFITLGFFSQSRDTGKSFSEYQFNRAVVTNELSELEVTKPSKNKKDPDYCPT